MFGVCHWAYSLRVSVQDRASARHDVTVMRYLRTLLGLLTVWRGASDVLLVRGTGGDVGDCQQSPCLSLSYAISQVQVNDIIRIGLGDETIFDLESLGRFMLLDAAAGHVTVQKMTVIRGNCAAMVGAEFGAGFALSLGEHPIKPLAMAICTRFASQIAIGSPATLRDMSLSRMDCTSPTVIEAGGGLQLRGGFRLSMSNVTFRRNTAPQNGGAISIRLIEDAPADIEMNDSIFESNHADSHGGAIHCSQISRQTVSLELLRVNFVQNSVWGDGGGIFYGCQSLKIKDSSFQANSASQGNGGALHLGRELECCTGSAASASFQNVQFLENAAKMGAVAFFDADIPTCAIPHATGLPDVYNASGLSPSAWSWADFNSSVSGNVATLGKLQATTPVRITLSCAGSSGSKTLSWSDQTGNVTF
eukprot:Skav200375  [mRNA]  locus=scaffold2518:340274:344568:- [translate_table: standard]